MYEALRAPLSPAQTDAYLARIGVPRQEPSPDYLDLLIRSQLRTVPFDDADVWVTGREPSLATEDLFAKIVLRRRGGYCFELNLLFLRLLQSLWFEAYAVIIHLGRPGGELGPPAHCGVIVTLEGQKRFADVGFGGPVPDGSVPLNGDTILGHRAVRSGVYTVVESLDSSGVPFPRFTFKDQPCDPVELLPMNWYVSRREGSGFAADLKLNLRADDGFAEIGGRRFRFRQGDTVIEREIQTPEEAKALAAAYFSIPELPIRPF